MKRFLTLLWFLCPVALFAQDYQQICRPGITFFAGTDHYLKAFRRDSIIPVGNNDTIFVSYPVIHDTASVYDCRDTTAGSALGKRILKEQNGWFRFFNRRHDTISIHAAAPVGGTWKFCSLPAGEYIQATVAGILPDSVLTTTDSVKVITLQTKNSSGGNIAGIFNQKTIKLSKSHGLTQVFDMYQTPFDTLNLILVGTTDPPMGEQLFDWVDIYNYDVGDEFHYYEDSGGIYPSPDWETLMIKTVLEKTVYGNDDSVHFVFDRCQRFKRTWLWYDSVVVTYQHDTVTEKYNFFSLSNNNAINWLHEEFLPSYSSSWGAIPLIIRHTAKYNERQELELRPKSFNFIFSSQCYQLTDFSQLRIYSYSPGLGCTHYYYLDPQWSNEDIELVYFRKGTETWGIP
ncbi:MAG TPA: hypothetical protein PK892_14395, partial [Bacteroidales bacterium]|nr:hypothetical protein [Bacteroidales bacterium]